MNPIWIAAIVDLLLLAALICSLVFNIRWVTNRKAEFARLGKIPHCPLMTSDILLLAAAIVLARSFPLSAPFLPLIAISAAILLYQFHNTVAFSYWRFEATYIFHYLRTGFKWYLTIFLPMTLIVLAVMGLCYLFKTRFTQPLVEQFLDLHNPLQIIGFLFFAIIVAPLWEEVTFRGVLYPFLKKYLPMGWAMFCSSFVWAAIHLHWPVLLPFTFLGCSLCFLYEKNGRLGNTIAVHMIFNLMNSLLLLFLKYYGHWQTF